MRVLVEFVGGKYETVIQQKTGHYFHLLSVRIKALLSIVIPLFQQ